MSNGTQNTLLDKPDLVVNRPENRDLSVARQIQQVLSVIFGMFRNQRVAIQASPTGMLNTGNPPLQDIVHYTATGDDETKQGVEVKTSMLMCMAHPDNAGRIWVRVHETASDSNAWPLDKGEVVKFSVTDLSQLHILFKLTDDTLIIGLTK